MGRRLKFGCGQGVCVSPVPWCTVMKISSDLYSCWVRRARSRGGTETTKVRYIETQTVKFVRHPHLALARTNQGVVRVHWEFAIPTTMQRLRTIGFLSLWETDQSTYGSSTPKPNTATSTHPATNVNAVARGKIQSSGSSRVREHVHALAIPIT